MFKKKEWIILLVSIFVFIFTLAIDQFTQTVYDLNLYEYIKYSQEFTTEEITYLENKNILRYTSDINAPPFSFQDKYTGLYKGFVIDYISALSIELNTDIEFIPRIWDEAIESVILGESDMIELYPSEDRKSHLLFTKSIYKLRAIVMTRNNEEEIKVARDLKGHKVAIEAGDYANEYITDNIPGVEIVSTMDYLESVNLLLNNEVDAIIGDEPILIYFTGDLSIENKIRILRDPLYELDICIGVNKSESQLVDILNKGILDLKKHDFAPKIQQKWFGLSTPVHKDKINVQIMFLLIIILILLVIIASGVSIWTYILKIQVTKRTKELIVSKNDLQMTFDALSDFLIVIDEHKIIQNINQSFADLLQNEKEDIIGRNYYDIPLLQNIDLETRTSNETSYNGRHYNYRIAKYKYGERILVSIEDNTNEIITRRQMLQHNKMIAVGQLAAGLAHEIRNPLGIIRNYTYVLKNKLKTQDELTEKALSTIETSVNRASKMVDNLLNFSRNNDEFNYIVLKETIDDIVALEKKSIENKNINLNILCNDSIGFHTKIESLTHIILNLLLNAVDAVSHEGLINIYCEKDEDYIYINISDNGQGINDQNIEYLFNPFYTTKKSGKGTGLGLYIVYNELQKIDGEITVHSKLGIGTTFKLKFKIKENEND